MKQRLKIRQIDDGLGVVLPQELLDQFGLKPGSELGLIVEDGTFFVTPQITLDELLSSMPDDEKFSELDSGPDVGKER